MMTPAPDRLRTILDGFTWRKDEDGQPIHITPGDAGGATNHGVILFTYAGWRRTHLGLPVTTVANLAGATLDQLTECIRAVVWNSVQGDHLPEGVDAVFFDFAFGSGGGIRAVQQLLGVTQDGGVGPRTLAAIAAWDRLKLIDAITERRNQYVRSLADYAKFGRGWDRRTRECRLFALGQLPPEVRAAALPRAIGLAPQPVGSADVLNGAELARVRGG